MYKYRYSITCIIHLKFISWAYSHGIIYIFLQHLKVFFKTKICLTVKFKPSTENSHIFSTDGWMKHKLESRFSSVQSLSRVRLFATPWTTARQVSLSIPNSQSPPKTMSIGWVMASNRLILCHPLLFLPSIFPSIRIFSNESALRIRWPKYWSFSFNFSPINEHPGLISFRMDWLDLLAVQGTLKGLLQQHIWKASILWHLAFFIVQLSHPYMTTGKTIPWPDGTLLTK